MSSETGEMWKAVKEQTRQHHEKMLEQADTTGWTAHTDYHYSRYFDGKRMDWWPSAGKAMFNGKIIYGHGGVNGKIAKLKKAETVDRQ